MQCLEGDDVELLGTFGLGDRNDRGRLFARWILQNGLLVQSRMTGMDHLRDSWTCRRSMDGALVQMEHGGQNTVGTANWRCIVATKDWVAGRTLRRTL